MKNDSRTIQLSSLSLLALLAAAVICAPALASAGDRCSADDLTSLEEAIPEATSRDTQIELAFYGIGLACTLPGSLNEAVKAMSSAPPDMRPMLLARGLSEDITALSGACAAPIQVLSNLGMAAPDDKLQFVAQGCDLTPLTGAADDVDPLGEDADALQVLTALAVHQALDEDGVDDAKKFARWMVGIDLPEPAESRFPPLPPPPPPEVEPSDP